MGAERRRRTVTVEDVRGFVPASPEPNGHHPPSNGVARPAAVAAPSPAPPGRARSRTPRRALAALTATLAVVLVGTALAAVNVAARTGPALEAMLPPETVVIDAGGPPTTIETTTTTAPRPELVALRGRPPSPVEADEATCAGPLKAGKLRPLTASQWTGRTPPSTTGEISDVDARAEIAQVMRRRFRRDDPERAVREALQLYESPRLRQIAEEQVTVRAALALLKGSLGEPVLRFALTTDRPLRIEYGTPTLASADAETWSYGLEMSVVVRELYRYESPVLLAPVLMHELMHQNGQSQQPEEVVNNILDIRVMMEMMRDAPSIFSQRTRVADDFRYAVLMQLNTRVGSVLAVDHSDVANVLPDFQGPPTPPIGVYLRTESGSEEGTRLYSILADAPTKGHATLVEILRDVAPDAEVPDKMFFDQSAVDLLDTNAGIGLCDQLVAAEVIGVVPRGTPAQKLARSFVNNLTK